MNEEIKLSTIFILLECEDYEGSRALHAFANKADAEDLKIKAEAYDELKPECPQCLDESDESNSEWDEFCKSSEEWRSKHPVGKGFGGASYYAINEIPFDA